MNQEETLFSAAVALPAAERPAYLDRACVGDATLRAVVESLLRAHDSESSLLKSAAPGLGETVAAFAPRPEEKAGDRIGRYKLLQQIGEGGCGVVYMAEQQEPVIRRVALKVIKLGMDTKAVIARFEAERQALAMMDHPNIAKVLDAGTTDNGRPFFVMELVRGIPITKYCDENNLSTADRLGLFDQVCHAIQHAHQKGIIHRDIKPSNILVTLHDGEPVPKVIDFGIAKATQGRLTDATVFTAFEQFIGTPAYMSPEQAEMSGLDIDTRSDIYSLGVLLYELLTGRPPFDPKSFVEAGLDEMRRMIREVEPPKPSTRLATLTAADRTTIAKLRGSAPAQLSSQLSGDLDWIVMKALEKNRTRRYESASALAADLQRHLGNEPVVARPPSTLYLLQKLVRRHRIACITAAAILASLVAALGISLWAYFNEKAARQFAVEAALENKKASDDKRVILIRAADQRRRADASDKQAAIATAQSAYAMALMKALIGRAAPDGDATRWRTPLDPVADRLCADAAIPPPAKAELCESFGDLYMALGEFGRAETMFREAVKLRRELQGEGHPDVMPVWRKLIESLQRQGKKAEAAKTQRDAEREQAAFLRSQGWIKTLRAQARDLQSKGQSAEAEAKLREAMAAGLANPYEGYDPLADLASIARVRFEAGDYAGARQLARECILAEKANRRWMEAGTFGFFVQTSDRIYLPPYDAHTILGLIALHDGDKAAARTHLLRSANGVTSRTELTGRDLELAAALVASGEQDAVLQFLDRVRPHYVDALEARNFTSAIFSLGKTEYYNAAIGKEHAQELSDWRMEVFGGKIPADWERPGASTPKAVPASMAALPPLTKSPLPPPASGIGLLYPLFPFAFLMLGWCATAVAPQLGARRSIPKAAAAWLIGFCAVRTLDVALFTGAIAGNGFTPDMLTSLYLSFFGWILLWAFLHALAPGQCSRWETRFMRAVFGFGLLELGATSLIGYMNGNPVVTIFCLVGWVLLLLLTFALAFGVCIVAARRIWRWQRTAGLSRGQQLSLKFAAPLLVAHGYVSLFAGVIHDNSAPAVASAIFWATALLPWLLAFGFFAGAPAASVPASATSNA